MRLGSYDLYSRTRFDNAIQAQGGTVSWTRRYYTTQTANSMGAVATDSATGRKVMFSFKATGNTSGNPKWIEVAAGAEDARWTGIGNMLAQIPNGGYYTFHHEPENDTYSGNNFGSSTQGDLFRAAFDRVANIIRPLAPHWKACANLFDVVFPSWEFGTKPGSWGGGGPSSTDPNRWIPATAEVLGVDYYAFRGASDGGSHWATNSRVYDYSTAVTDFLSYASSHGVPLCFPEFGYIIRDPAVTPGDEANRTVWLQGFANQFATNPNITACMWFEVNEIEVDPNTGNTVNTGKSNHSITHPTTPPINTGTVAAFVSFDAIDPPPPPPPPPEYIPGLITVAGHMRMHTS